MPRSYVVSRSETGEVSRDDVRQDRLFHKRNVKMGIVAPGNMFSTREKVYLYLQKCTILVKSGKQMTS
jgi:hypothetical protein